MTTQPAGNQQDRDPGIDLLRGLAIMGVILFHLWGFTTGRFAFPARHSVLLGEIGDKLQDFQLLGALTAIGELALRSGRDGVSMFIILSGTALMMSALRSGMPDVRSFYSRRLPRVIRAYWVGILIVVLSLLLLAIPKTLIDGRSYTYNWTHIGRATYFDLEQLLAGIAIVPRLLRLEWYFAPVNPLWFVVLILEFYLAFPVLFRLFDRFGAMAVVLAALMITILFTAVLLFRYDGRLGPHGWITTIWLPFRLFDFVLGMAVGHLLVRYRFELRDLLNGAPAICFCMVGGVAMYLAGASIDDEDAYWRTIAFPLIALGLVAFALPFLLKPPGRLETSVIGATLIWIGPMSLSVLIMNEPFRFVDHYLWFKGQTWTWGWWFYIVVLYVPGTLVTATVLSRLLGLTPASHPAQLLRNLFNASPGAGNSGASRASHAR